MATPAYIYNITLPKTANHSNRNPHATTTSNTNNKAANPNTNEATNSEYDAQRRLISTPASTVSKAPSMFMESHRKSLYMKDYTKRKGIPNIIYNSNYREKVSTNHPLDSLTVNKVRYYLV